ncbi:hypothetical protein PPERSA_09522 [Pseudocohnilembus persalinus]|uniref:Uncharacterized protein n=1 Tax=Pseudocohnilembus persalinus TaxID=266149 RepID=A0A0V0QFF2_PSEPJ|nr:hypothetical protein PPERSA_09522 [Pseudocohnilembus persalinus]|eukprot:KRX00916.1 hypothetical protein PPERSA_09522 [Pseudocohnilembus persalinus]
MDNCNFTEDNLAIMYKLMKFQNKQLQSLISQQEQRTKEVIDEYNKKLKAREKIIDQYEQEHGNLDKQEKTLKQLNDQENGVKNKDKYDIFKNNGQDEQNNEQEFEKIDNLSVQNKSSQNNQPVQELEEIPIKCQENSQSENNLQ